MLSEAMHHNETAEKIEPSQPQETGASPMRAVLRRLFDELHARRIRYCHWKSNIRLQDALTGDDDVDLLVERAQASVFHQALMNQGFKLIQSRGSIGHPAIFHAVALDEERLELVHLHAYFQIVSGDSLVKNYRLAVEDALLDHTRMLHGVRAPAAELELVLFVLRTALKHVQLVEILMARRDAKKSAEELKWLLATADLGRAAELWKDLFPELDEDLLERLVAAFGDEDVTLARRIALGHRTAWRLRGRRRYKSIRAGVSRMYRIVTMLAARFRQRKDFVPETGGMIIALVGPKATGKSTLSSALAERLGAYMDVVHVHAGKPPATVLTFAPRLLLPLARRLFPAERPGEYEKKERRTSKKYSMLYCLRMMMLAHDRRVLLGRALRLSAAGTLVISDRYPSAVTGAIDSSCFGEDVIATTNSRMKRWMMMRERAAYKRMPKPGFVVRLSAPMETAIMRDAARMKEGGPDAEAVRRRWEIETGGAFECRTVEVRTDRPLDETVAAVVKAVWAVT